MAFLSAAGDAFQMLSWPGLLLGNAIQTLLGGAGYWDGAFIILGNLIIPVLFVNAQPPVPYEDESDYHVIATEDGYYIMELITDLVYPITEKDYLELENLFE